jgi:hypothetical protein
MKSTLAAASSNCHWWVLFVGFHPMEYFLPPVSTMHILQFNLSLLNDRRRDVLSTTSRDGIAAG